MTTNSSSSRFNFRSENYTDVSTILMLMMMVIDVSKFDGDDIGDDVYIDDVDGDVDED